MARMRVKNFEDVQARLDRIEQKARAGLAMKICEAGAAVYVEKWKESIERHKHVASSEMLKNVKIVESTETAGGAWLCNIRPDGYDDRGVANDLKANVIHLKYDNKFVKEAEKAAEAPARAAMMAVLDEFVGKE